MNKLFVAGVISALFVSFTAPVLAAGIKDVLPGAKKMSGVVPAMGEHWVSKKFPGAVFGQYKDKIIFLEYEVIKSELGDKNIRWDKLAMPAFMPKINHTDIEYLAKGHRNMEFPHVVFHMYTVSHAEHMSIKPPKRPAGQPASTPVEEDRY